MIRRRRNLEAECLAAFNPPIQVHEPELQSGPLVLASPHSGRIYPAGFLARAGVSAQVLRQNEDCYIDEMLGFARHMDIPLLNALFPRCFVDVNRAADELPSSWRGAGSPASTTRAEMGLGVIPTIISDKLPIYRRQLKPADVMPRLAALYAPYHDALAQLLRRTHAQFGRALLFDCHSMPGFTMMGQRRPDIVLGDRHGSSCRPETIERLESLFLERGYSTTRNHPYAGGFVTSHYGRPDDNVEVIQIEINRDLYLNPITFNRKSGYARLANDLKNICWEMLPQANLQPQMPLAAE